MYPRPLLAVLLLLLLGTPALGHDTPGVAAPGTRAPARVLGTLDFPTSTRSAEAQAAFLRGMLLLHLFEYPFAREEFQHAQSIDPGFAMAYWGEAMVYNHPIWDQQDRDAARAVLDRLGPTAAARAATTTSQKEKDYLEGVDILYGEGPRELRDRAYLQHMERMAQHYPEDHEVRLFQALAIMGAGAGVRDIPAYMEAAALAQSVFCANRQHPGAAHYLIHAVDDPVHAPLGLEAARALALMAPDAGHSLHMTSHIFTALGMWDDVVDANRNAVRVADAMAREHGEQPRPWGHYNFWLLYGLLQQGRDAQARQLLETARAGLASAAPADPLLLDPDNSPLGSVVQMWARYLLETGGSDTAVAAWHFDFGDAYDPQLTYAYTQAMLAQQADGIRRRLADFRALEARLAAAVKALPRQAPGDLLYLQRLGVMREQIEAALARANGDMAGMLQHAREANRLEGEMPYSFGPPFVDLPSAELLGRMALAAGQHDEAAAAFRLQLQRSRRKAAALLGLATAERARGDSAASDNARATYLQIRAHADAAVQASGT